ncbi:hypothetical protein KFU94_62080 [Chloroflexi bacterium TSY]|nr:hypothetical protein [Chloroflexi bacterium TSY]
MNAKFERTNSHQSFSQDLTTAIKLAEGETPAKFAQVVRASVIYITLRSVVNAMSPELIGMLAHTGKPELTATAEGSAALILEPLGQTRAYQFISEAYIEDNRLEKAKSNIRRGLRAATAIGSTVDKANTLVDLAKLISQLDGSDCVDELLSVVKTQSENDAIAFTLGKIARIFAFSGKKDVCLLITRQSIAVAKMLNDESILVYGSHEPYALAAVALSRVGEQEKSAEYAALALNAAKAKSTKAISVLKVTQILLELVEKEKAIEAANEASTAIEALPDGMTKLICLSELAKYLAKLGETDKAVSAANGVLRTTNMIASGYKAEALSNISQTFALLDNQETAVSVAEMALEAAKTIGKAENKTGILARVVTPALELTDSKKLLHCALEIIDSTKVPLWERSGCIKMIAEAMCKINDREGLRQALVVADRCDSEWERLTALGSVASYMIKLGEDRQAIAVANQALAEARSLFGDEYDKSAALGAIAMAQARVGTPEGIKRALSVVDSLIPVYRAATLVAVAQFLYASGKKRQASKIISRVSTIIESFRGLTPRDSFALIRLAQALNYLNRKQELNKLVTKVKAAHGDDYTHNLLTLAIASQMNGKLPGQVHEFINDQIENIKDVATNVESNWRQGPVLGILVNGMLEMGYFEQIADLNRDGTINIDELEIKWKKAAQHSMKAQLLAAVGNKSESLSTLLTAIADSREWSRNSLFRVLEYGSEILADIDQGVTLWDIYEAIRNVDSWWHTANDSYFMSHRYLSLRNRMIENFGKNVIGKCSVVTPLSVQLAIDLFVNLQANGRNSLSIESGRNTLEIVSVSELEHASQHYRGLFLQMIEKLGKRMGLHIPSVEFRVDESYRYPGSYTISVNETVVARQQLSYERQLYAGPVQRLHDLKVVGYRTCNPRTGEDAYWILRQNWEKVEDAKGRLWNNLEYIIGHSEAIIGKNLGVVHFSWIDRFTLLETERTFIFSDFAGSQRENGLI